MLVLAEEFRHNVARRRPWLMFAVLIGGIAFFTRWLFPMVEMRMTGAEVFVWAILLSMVALPLQAQMELRSPDNPGMPRRLYLLPVGTARLVAWQMLIGAGGLVAMLLGVSAVMTVTGIWHMPSVFVVMHFVAVLAGCQLLVWGLPGFSFLRLAIGTATALSSMVVLMELTRNGHEPLPLTLRTSPLLLLLAGFVFACYGMLVWLVSLDRRGSGWPGWGVVARRCLPWLPARRVPRVRAFGSALQAQAWFEWRVRAGYLCLTGVLLALVLVRTLHEFKPEVSRTVLIFGLLVALPCISVAAAHGFGFRYSGVRRKTEWELPAFLCARPLDAKGIAAPALLAFARGIAAAIALPLLVAAGPAIWTGGLHAAGGLLMLAAISFTLTWALGGCALAMVLGGRQWLAAQFPLALLLAIAPMYCAVYVGRGVPEWEVLATTIAAACAWLLGLCVSGECLYVLARGRRLSVLPMWLLAVIGCAVFVLWWPLLSVIPFLPQASGSAIALALALMCAAPFAAAPLGVESNRAR